MEAIQAAGEEGLGVVIAPIAFVSEHVETLVELDHDYAARAAEWTIEPYIRVPALGVQPEFIESLALMTLSRLQDQDDLKPGSSFRCPECWSGCPTVGRRAEQPGRKAA